MQLRVLGVYQLEVTPVFAEQLPMYGDEDQCRDHFSSVVLIEIMVDSPNEPFSLDSFTQPNHAHLHVTPQAPWDEGLLSLDGRVLSDRRINCAKKTGRVRLAFYITIGPAGYLWCRVTAKRNVPRRSPCLIGSR